MSDSKMKPGSLKYAAKMARQPAVTVRCIPNAARPGRQYTRRKNRNARALGFNTAATYFAHLKQLAEVKA